MLHHRCNAAGDKAEHTMAMTIRFFGGGEVKNGCDASRQPWNILDGINCQVFLDFVSI
jgi:hypothetical protein